MLRLTPELLPAPALWGQGDDLVPDRLASLEALYEAHHRRALGLAMRLVDNQAEAEEVVQDAFLAVWRAMDRFDGTRGSASTWILSVVRNRALDVLRARKRRPVTALDPEQEHADPCNVAELALAAVQGDTVRRSVASLPPAQRQALELAFFRGLSHSEIAAQLQVPVGTVKGRIRLALARLRISLGAESAAQLAA